MRKAEFIATDAYRYNCTGPIRWVISHVMRYKGYLALFACTTLLTNGLSAAIPIVTGRAFDIVLQGNADHTRLFYIALGILSLVLAKSVVDIAARVAAEFIGKRVTRDARDEVYLSLLGKSQTFHNRQRVGDLMARATNDVSRLSDMIVPGIDTIVDSFVRLTLTLVFIGLLQPQLLFAPVLFIVAFLVALRAYSRMLNPIAASTRTQFGDLNADLTEALVQHRKTVRSVDSWTTPSAIVTSLSIMGGFRHVTCRHSCWQRLSQAPFCTASSSSLAASCRSVIWFPTWA